MNWKVNAGHGSELVEIDSNDGQGFRIQLSDNEPMRGAYSIFIPAFVPAATPTDIISIQGSATKTIRIRAFQFSGVATTASNIFINTVRRSAANTAGTPTTLSGTRRALTDDAPSATIKTFGANPSALGAVVDGGFGDGGRLNIAPAANGSIDRLMLQYSWLNDRAPTLSGVTDFLNVSLAPNPTTLTGSAWPAGGALDVNIIWTED